MQEINLTQKNASDVFRLQQFHDCKFKVHL